MTAHNISRRHFVAALTAILGTSACVPAPLLTEGPPRVGPLTAMRLGPAPIKGPDAKFAFVKIAGAPVNHAIEFDRALDSEAAARNLKIVPVGDPSATYLVKGYLSAVGDRGGTWLVYVWDVSDMTGRRLHRVTGEESSSGSAADPWSGISSETVRIVARRTIDDLISWAS